MRVYVVTNVEDGWDCVRGVFLSAESLIDYFNEIEITYWGEDSDKKMIANFTGMSALDIEDFLANADSSFIIHEMETQ